MSERLERVTALRQLGTGMKVAIMPCTWCGARRHDTMLLNPGRMLVADPDGTGAAFVSGFRVTHRRRCLPAVYRQDSVNEATVAHGVVFKVLDGLEEPSTEAAAASGTTRRTPQKERA